MGYQKYINEIINSIENNDMKQFINELLKTIPNYWYHAPASSSGRYHPQYALNDGGLLRHTVALVRFLNFTFETEMFKFDSRERDILRIAGLMHDSRKSGSQEDYEKNKYTKFDHPLLAAEVVKSFLGCGIIKDEEIKIISNTIETHMGRWNTDKRSDIVLPTPSNKYQKLLHWADYMASRKCIEMLFDGFEVEKPTIETFIIPFGKYKDKALSEVIENDKEYLIWLRDKADMELREPLKSLIANL